MMSGESSKFVKLEYRAVIKYLTLKKLKASEIHKDMCSVYGDFAPSHEAIRFWSRQFKQGRES